MADGRPPKVGGLREDGLTGSVKGGRPTRAASLAKAADGAGIVGAISKFLARAPPPEEGEGDGGRGAPPPPALPPQAAARPPQLWWLLR